MTRERLRRLALSAKPAGVAVKSHLMKRNLMCPPMLQEATINGSQAMVALVHGPCGTPVTYHLTNLDTMQTHVMQTPASVEGAAIRLQDAAPVMGVAVGIETALYASRLLERPVWAVVDDDAMESFAPPDVCELLVVFGTRRYRSQSVAYKLASELRIESVVSILGCESYI